MNGPDLVMALTRVSVETAALAGLVWAVARLWPAMPARARAAAWWLLSLRALVALVPLPRFDVSLPRSSAPVTALVERPVAALAGAPVLSDPVRLAPALPHLAPLEIGALVLAGLWIAGMVAGAVLMVRRMAAMRREWRDAGPCLDPRVAAWRADWALPLGRDGVPEVRVGATTRVPLTVGALRPGILLPRGCEQWSDDTLRLVFAHELSHARRRDPFLGVVPALAELVFWFHPLVRLAAREYLAAREEVCDEEALTVTGAAPRDYGALLLQFGVGKLPLVPGTAACGALRGRHLKRRLAMLSRSSWITTPQRIAGVALVLMFALLAFAPVRLVGAEEGWKSSEDGRSKTPFAYLLLTRGEENMTGAIDEADLDYARSLKSPREDLLYFRIGQDMWISNDPRLRREWIETLAPERALEKEQAPLERKRQSIESERLKVQERVEALDARKERLLDRRADLQEQVGDGHREREVAIAIEEVEDDLADLRVEREQAAAELRGIHDRMSALYRTQKRGHYERDRVHQQCMMELMQVARRAIRDERAQPWRP
jgi:beta-lactamase regulating signal transducer with metallopeptidase domain